MYRILWVLKHQPPLKPAPSAHPRRGHTTRLAAVQDLFRGSDRLRAAGVWSHGGVCDVRAPTERVPRVSRACH